MEKHQHIPQVAGLFYPGEENQLRNLVRELLEKQPPCPKESKIKALIAPHAGYIYSGSTAARAYQEVWFQSFERVLVLGPMHRVYHRGISIYSKGSFLTPLGEIQVDEEFCSRLIAESPHAAFLPQAYQQEHSLEVHLPFLQVSLKNSFELVPILIGDLDAQALDQFAAAIREALEASTKTTLIVVSTDFSHFFSAQEAQALDHRGRDFILKGDARGLMEANQKSETSLCGIHPVYTLLRLFPEYPPQFLEYTHSGQVSGDHQSVVGYMSFKLEE